MGEVNCIEIAYADRRDDRMIIVFRAGWTSLEAQQAAFNALPEVDDSDFIVDFHDREGSITDDKLVAPETVERVTGVAIKELIRRGRIREAALSRMVRNRYASTSGEPQP